MIQTLRIRTTARIEFRDITRELQEAVRETNVQSGVCDVFVPHTTAGITVNEHADPSVVEDIGTRLDALVPQDCDYRHAEGNAPAHVKASLIGSSQNLLVDEQQLRLGTWQGVFFCEFDGPRDRQVLVKVTQG